MRVIGVGIDLVDLERVDRLIRRKGDRALRRLLTPGELAYVRSRPDPVPHVAARLAAKEAVYKSLQSLEGSRGVGWREIEVSHEPAGRPAVCLHGLAERLVGRLPSPEILLSLTHSAKAAGAVAILTAAEPVSGGWPPA
ncbi:MAG TPA: holo-ACP synthase [Gemmatimonadales bacterium]|nr:holo-ACP synthase [Gemmatimonadales bacterium]